MRSWHDNHLRSRFRWARRIVVVRSANERVACVSKPRVFDSPFAGAKGTFVRGANDDYASPAFGSRRRNLRYTHGRYRDRQPALRRLLLGLGAGVAAAG